MMDYEEYYVHLNSISVFGKLYKRFFISQVLYLYTKRFGYKIAEIGSGTGNGILGAYPNKVVGFEINPLAVSFCKNKKLVVHRVDEDKKYPAHDGEFDVCILDNVLEHLADPTFVLQECARMTHDNAGLIIAVPGNKGYQQDADHKKHYRENDLINLNQQWQLKALFSVPFYFKCAFLSNLIPQYCLIAIYEKSK